MATIKSKSSDEWRSKRSQEQLMLGGLPLNAEWRLRTLCEGKLHFTSSLSVNEFVLTRAERIAPLGQVTGNCSYHVGWPPVVGSTSMEMKAVSRAHNQAWRLAFSRLQAEAKVLGAHGVVGVTMDARPSTWSDKMLEVKVQGTAIKWQGARVTGAPFVSALSGQDFWALLSAGYRPVGVAFGTSVYQQVTTNATRLATGSGLLNSSARVNQKLKDYSYGLQKSRRIAVQSMEDEARQLGAEGVVGVRIEKQISTREVEVELYGTDKKQKREDLVIQFFILGTAIGPFLDFQPVVHAVVPLN